MNYTKGIKMYWKSSGLAAYEKTDNEDFGWWRSLQYDTDKPLDKRYGFKWTDQQVFDYYKGIMNFSN